MFAILSWIGGGWVGVSYKYTPQISMHRCSHLSRGKNLFWTSFLPVMILDVLQMELLLNDEGLYQNLMKNWEQYLLKKQVPIKLQPNFNA